MSQSLPEQHKITKFGIASRIRRRIHSSVSIAIMGAAVEDTPLVKHPHNEEGETMLSKLSRVVALFVLAITLNAPVRVLSTPVQKSVQISRITIEFGRKNQKCTRFGICDIRPEKNGPVGSARTVKGTAEIKGRQMAITFGNALPEKGDVLPIDEDITLDQETANRLGFKTVVVLKGTYQINRTANEFGTLSLNVRTTK